MKSSIFVLVLMFATTAFASSVTFVEMPDYSRPLVRSLAISFLSGRLEVPSEKLKQGVDEIVVNDQMGTAKYAVEVYFKDGSAYVVNFSNLDPIDLD
jgi:hypothetical protein